MNNGRAKKSNAKLSQLLSAAIKDEEIDIPDPPSNFSAACEEDTRTVAAVAENNSNPMTDDNQQQFIINELIDLRSITENLHQLNENQVSASSNIRVIKTYSATVMEQQAEILLLLKSGTSRNATEAIAEDSDDEQDCLPQMPFQTSQQFLNFNKNLRANKNVRDRFKSRTAKIGGRDQNKVISKIMKMVMTDELAEKFTWIGAGGKFAMNDKEIPKIIFNVLRKEYNVKLRMEETDKIIKGWLRTSGARIRNAERSARTEELKERQRRQQEEAAMEEEI